MRCLALSQIEGTVLRPPAVQSMGATESFWRAAFVRLTTIATDALASIPAKCRLLRGKRFEQEGVVDSRLLADGLGVNPRM